MNYSDTLIKLQTYPKKWVITGVAGFIGSHLLECLLTNGQRVIGIDNFITGKEDNLKEVKNLVAAEAWKNFDFQKGDIRNFESCQNICSGADIILHQAALGSVPRSIENPLATHEHNINGHINMLVASKEAGVRRFVYASSSSVYGDSPELPKVEDRMGTPLSPYALTKKTNELYAKVFSTVYDISTIGLRYFNVFGARQDPEGPYAAVIPKWIEAIAKGGDVVVNGDGLTSRDFCYVKNVVQANILAGTIQNPEALNRVYNVAFGERTTLNQLFKLLSTKITALSSGLKVKDPVYRDERPGDVRHSHADISAATQLLGYKPKYDIKRGLDRSLEWYMTSN